MTEHEGVPVRFEYRLSPPVLKKTMTLWRAWCENFEGWDGEAVYADRQVAQQQAAVDYVSESHGWTFDGTNEDESPDVELSWVISGGRWCLLSDGLGTGVYLAPEGLFDVDPNPDTEQ